MISDSDSEPPQKLRLHARHFCASPGPLRRSCARTTSEATNLITRPPVRDTCKFSDPRPGHEEAELGLEPRDHNMRRGPPLCTTSPDQHATASAPRCKRTQYWQNVFYLGFQVSTPATARQHGPHHGSSDGVPRECRARFFPLFQPPHSARPPRALPPRIRAKRCDPRPSSLAPLEVRFGPAWDHVSPQIGVTSPGTLRFFAQTFSRPPCHPNLG